MTHKYFKSVDLQELDHYPTKGASITDIGPVNLDRLQSRLARNDLVIIPLFKTIPDWLYSEHDRYWKWVNGIHLRNKIELDLEGAKSVFAVQVKEIVNQIGWSAEAVRDITVAWALYYGTELYLSVHGYRPVYGDAFIEAALQADSLDELIKDPNL